MIHLTVINTEPICDCSDCTSLGVISIYLSPESRCGSEIL